MKVKIGITMQSTRSVFLFLLALVFSSAPLLANIDLYEFSNEQNQVRYKVLTKELRCPKCQNQDIADSNAPIAEDMRREVHRLLEEGEEEQAIVDFMVDRFGEFVSYKPRVKPATYLLWYGPWSLLFLGVVVIVFMVGRRASKRTKAGSVARSSNKEIVLSEGEQKVRHDQHKKVEQLLSRFKDD